MFLFDGATVVAVGTGQVARLGTLNSEVAQQLIFTRQVIRLTADEQMNKWRQMVGGQCDRKIDRSARSDMALVVRDIFHGFLVHGKTLSFRAYGDE